MQRFLLKNVTCQIIPQDINVHFPGNKGDEMFAVMDYIFRTAFNSPQVNFQSALNTQKPLAAWKEENQF